jgi:uncharacterized delta-60 repeat protein
MSRIWRVLLMVVVLCFGAAAIAGGASAKPSSKPSKPGKPKKVAPGTLDSTFGEGGKVTAAFPAGDVGGTGVKYTLPFEFKPGHLEMAQAPGGKIFVAGATKIVCYLADGKPDKGFGNGGSVTVPRPPGAVFVLAGVAVDSYGRIVLAGLARPLPSNSAPDPLLSSAALMRFNADGTPDLSFGSGGLLITDLGLAAPKASGGPYPGASVGLRDIVIDAQNRPVVTGAYVTSVGSGAGTAESQGFVARLTEAGVPDPSFGDGGLRTISTLDSLGTLAAWSSGYLTLAERSENPRHVITGIDANGNLDTSFASFGFRNVPFSAAPALAVAPSGKLMLLGNPERRRSYRKKKVKDEKTGKVVTEKVRIYVKVQTVQRLLPSGAADPSFGHSGSITYNDPKVGSYAAIGVDAEERGYLAGRIGKPTPKKKNATRRTSFILSRIQANSYPDRSFGKEAVVTTDFGAGASSFATQVVVDSKGRILVGGGIISPQLETGSGFAIARYLPGS